MRTTSFCRVLLPFALVPASLVPVLSAQTVVYVNAAAGNGGNGASWATAFNTLPPALAAATAGDEVWVTRGTYKCGGASFKPGNGVGLYGGFLGAETAKNQRVVGVFPTILDGEGLVGVVQLASSAPATTVLDGLTITGGRAKDGAGVSTYGGSPKVNHVIFVKNVAADPATSRPSARGGAFYTYSGTPVFTDCVFEENRAQSAGGGFYSYEGPAVFERCRFIKNVCDDSVSTTSASANGGGCYTYSGALQLTDCDFVENKATFGGSATRGSAAGGAFYSYEGDFVLTEVRFLRNESQGNGGAHYSYQGARKMLGCQFVGNKAVAGGAIWTYEEKATISGCEFRGNIASGTGGGIYTYSGTHDVISTLFAGNAAQGGSGGGIYSSRDETNPPGRMSVLGCTFAANTTSSNGGGLYTGGTPVVTGSIFWGNTASSSAEIQGSATVTYSAVQGGFAGAGNIAVDPRFRAPLLGDYQLDAGSPCIDAGDNGALPAGETADALCNPRRLDDPKTPDSGLGTAPIVDMGAFEFTGVVATAGTREDLVLWSGVNAPAKRGTARLVQPTDVLDVLLISPEGTFNNGFAMFLLEAFVTGSPPVPLPFLPGIATGANTLLVPVGPLPSTGLRLSLVVPSGGGGLSVLLQGGVASMQANNGQYAASNAVEFRL